MHRPSTSEYLIRIFEYLIEQRLGWYLAQFYDGIFSQPFGNIVYTVVQWLSQTLNYMVYTDVGAVLNVVQMCPNFRNDESI
jgi:hypothetical protein